MAREDTRLALDKKSESILYEGANLSQLGILFKCDHRVLKERMHGINPVGKRSGYDIYDISEVAGRMGKLTEEQVDKAIRRLNHADLPKALTKEFWAGLKSKQDYELRAGDLWPTSKVVEEVSEMVKAMNMELNLLVDAIERQVEMSERQREIAKALVKGAKLNMLKRLHEKFDNPEPAAIRPPAAVAEDDDEL